MHGAKRTACPARPGCCAVGSTHSSLPGGWHASAAISPHHSTPSSSQSPAPEQRLLGAGADPHMAITAHLFANPAPHAGRRVTPPQGESLLSPTPNPTKSIHAGRPPLPALCQNFPQLGTSRPYTKGSLCTHGRAPWARGHMGVPCLMAAHPNRWFPIESWCSVERGKETKDQVQTLRK